MNPYLKLMRPFNCGMASLSIPLVAIILGGVGYLTDWMKILLGMLVVFLATGGGNALNDYYDREVDVINHPERPIPSGKIEAKNALLLSLILFFLALLLSAMINLYTLIIALIAEAAMFLYEAKLKNQGISGNVTVSALVGLVFIFGGAMFDEFCKVTVFAIMAFAANLGREIVKDIEDMEGDINRMTLPKRVGATKAALVSSMAFLLAVLISPIPYFYLSFSQWYLIFVAISDAIFIYTTAIQFRDPRRAQKTAKLGMLMGLIAYLIGGLI